MSKNPKGPNLHLTATDVEAILCALPLMDCIEAQTPAQQELNSAAMSSAAKKLTSHGSQLDANDLRVISASLFIAREFLAGRMPELGSFVEPDHQAALRRHLFTINRLEPVFDGIISPLL